VAEKGAEMILMDAATEAAFGPEAAELVAAA
jgi:choline dehydrogenase